MMSVSFEKQVVENMAPSVRPGIEDELFALGVWAPELVEDLASVFKEALTDALANMLDESTAEALEVYLGKVNLGDPAIVFPALDSTLREGAKTVKEAVCREFRVKVHERYEMLVISQGPALRGVLPTPREPTMEECLLEVGEWTSADGTVGFKFRIPLKRD